MNKKFTFIELLIVVAVIGVLLTLLLPSLGKSREMAKRAVCLSNNSQLHRAAYLFSANNNTYLPNKTTKQSQVPFIYSHDTAYKNTATHLAKGLQPNSLGAHISPYVEIEEDGDSLFFHCPSQKYTNYRSTASGKSHWQVSDYSYFANQNQTGSGGNKSTHKGWIDYATRTSDAAETPLFADGLEYTTSGAYYTHNNHTNNYIGVSARKSGIIEESASNGINQVHLDGSGRWFRFNQIEIAFTTYFNSELFWAKNYQ
ncbi:MAG: hypothetical protein NE330_07630 [Lentisphaeraceae bacterium]|nr:hypothetical protein [Lentisphaeraceae bacterium]